MSSFRFHSQSSSADAADYERQEPRLGDTNAIDPALLREEEDWAAPCAAQRSARWGIAAGVAAAATALLIAQAFGVSFRERVFPPACTPQAHAAPNAATSDSYCDLRAKK